MPMEHRCGARKPLNLEVTIHCPRLGSVRAQARDISIGGMFVQTATGFVVNEPVTIDFRSPPAHAAHHWYAAVVHTTSNGAGLIFDTFRSTELATLLDLLHVADECSRAAVRPISPADRDLPVQTEADIGASATGACADSRPH